VEKIAVAGSLVRDHDTVGDIDLVIVPSGSPLPNLSSVTAINLFITEEAYFEPCYLHYAIGKAIIHLKKKAKEKGFKLDQEGLHKADQNVTSIKEIYNALDSEAPLWLLDSFSRIA
jgi:DNA polymerase/3'-5' exonuclease PolX